VFEDVEQRALVVEVRLQDRRHLGRALGPPGRGRAQPDDASMNASRSIVASGPGEATEPPWREVLGPRMIEPPSASVKRGIPETPNDLPFAAQRPG